MQMQQGPRSAAPVAYGMRRSLLRSRLLVDADGLTGNDELDAAILRTACRGSVVSDRISFAVTSSTDAVHGNALLREEIANCIGAILRELLVVVIATDDVCVAFDLQLQAGVCL